MKLRVFSLVLFLLVIPTGVLSAGEKLLEDTSNYVKYTQSDTCYLKVHFLYGSRPGLKYKKTEKKWFGGILGGHVGVEGDSNVILNFCPKGKFHIFQHKKIHSCYKLSNVKEFDEIFDTSKGDSFKKLIVFIPVTRAQKIKFDSLQATYMLSTPYDYAFLGMRCGAAAYDVLSSVGILKKMSYHKTWSRIFYPRRLRKRIIKMAVKNHWQMYAHNGSTKRKWEKD